MKKIIAVSVTSAFIFLSLLVLKLLRVTENMLILSLIGAGLFLLGAFVLKILSPKMRSNRFFSVKSMSFLEWQIAFCFCILLICGSFLINYLTALFYDLISLSVPPAFSGSGYSSLGVAVLCIAVLPAIFEELFFRGAVLTMLRTAKLKTVAAIGLSAAFFTILHGPSWYFLSDFYAGVLLALLIYLTGSIYAAVTVHFLSNFVSFFLASYGERLTDAGVGDLTVHILIVCLIGSVCHLLHLMKKLILRHEKEDRSRINENSRRWEEKVAKGEK